MPPKTKSTRSATRSNSSTDEGISSGREEEVPRISGFLSYSDPITVAHVLNPDIVPLQHPVAQEAGRTSVIPHNSQHLAEPLRDNAPSLPDSFPNGHSGNFRDHVSILQGGSGA